MRKYRIHQTIEYIRRQSEFPFDAGDVEERLDDVLAHFGIREPFDVHEREELTEYLLPLGVSFEVGETTRVRQRREDYVMGVHVPVPSERTLSIRRQRFLQQYGRILQQELLALMGTGDGAPRPEPDGLCVPMHAIGVDQ